MLFKISFKSHVFFSCRIMILAFCESLKLDRDSSSSSEISPNNVRRQPISSANFRTAADLSDGEVEYHSEGEMLEEPFRDLLAARSPIRFSDYGFFTGYTTLM